MFGRTFDDNNELIIDPAYIDDDVIFITGTKEEPKVNRSDVEKQIFGDDEKESKEGKSFRCADWHDKIVDIKLPQKMIDKFMSEIDCVVVNTYENDDYHLSDEERAKNNELYELFKPIIHAKNNYTVLPDFVNVMRACIKCIDYIAETNGVYSPKKFKKKVYSGKIKIEGLRFPKLSKKAKKRISLEYLTDFILSDEPAENIMPPEREFDTIRSEEEIEEMTHKLFTEEELNEIFKPLTEDQKIRSQLFDATTDEQSDDLPTCVVFDEKKSMKILKTFPEINLYLKRTNARSKRKNRFNSREWEFNNTFDDKTDKDNLDYFVDDEGCEWFGVPVTIDIDFDFIIYIPSYSKDSHKLWTKKGKYRDGILKINIRNGSPLIMIKYSERGKICKPKLIKSSFNKSDDTSSLNDIINLIDNNIEDIIIALYNTSINANTDESGSLENCKLEISNYSIDPRDYPRPKTVNEVIDDYIKRSERYV